jgi:hypothetical protein
MPARTNMHVYSFEKQLLYKSHMQETSDPIIKFTVLFHTLHQMTSQPLVIDQICSISFNSCRGTKCIQGHEE